MSTGCYYNLITVVRCTPGQTLQTTFCQIPILHCKECQNIELGCPAKYQGNRINLVRGRTHLISHSGGCYVNQHYPSQLLQYLSYETVHQLKLQITKSLFQNVLILQNIPTDTGKKECSQSFIAYINSYRHVNHMICYSVSNYLVNLQTQKRQYETKDKIV